MSKIPKDATIEIVTADRFTYMSIVLRLDNNTHPWEVLEHNPMGKSESCGLFDTYAKAIGELVSRHESAEDLEKQLKGDGRSNARKAVEEIMETDKFKEAVANPDHPMHEVSMVMSEVVRLTKEHEAKKPTVGPSTDTVQ